MAGINALKRKSDMQKCEKKRKSEGAEQRSFGRFNLEKVMAKDRIVPLDFHFHIKTVKSTNQLYINHSILVIS